MAQVTKLHPANMMCKWTLSLAIVTLLAEGSDSTAASVEFLATTDTCTPSHQRTVLEAVLGCQPRPTIVELSYPDDAVTGSNSIEQVRLFLFEFDHSNLDCTMPSLNLQVALLHVLMNLCFCLRSSQVICWSTGALDPVMEVSPTPAWPRSRRTSRWR